LKHGDNISESLVIATTILLFIKGYDSIVLRRIGVPTYAVKGRQAVLTCDFDLEGQALYSVKWYKSGLEFYRYIPGNKRPMTYYVRAGVRVDKKHSDERQVTLKDLSMKSTGRYRCEVSTEAPTFETVSSYGDMIVVVLPERGPRISGGRERYDVGDLVDVNCTSSNSKPAAQLQWLVNDQPADPRYYVRYPILNISSQSTTTSHRHSKTKDRGGGGSRHQGGTSDSDRVHTLHTTTLGLRFRVQKRHFFKGAPASLSDPDFKPGDYGLSHTGMTLKCTASINTHDWQKVPVPRPQGVRDGHGQGSHGEDLPSPMRRRDHRTTEDWTLTPEGTGRDRALATYSEDTRGFLSDYPAPESLEGDNWPYHDAAATISTQGYFFCLAIIVFTQLSYRNLISW